MLQHLVVTLSPGISKANLRLPPPHQGTISSEPTRICMYAVAVRGKDGVYAYNRVIELPRSYFLPFPPLSQHLTETSRSQFIKIFQSTHRYNVFPTHTYNVCLSLSLCAFLRICTPIHMHRHVHTHVLYVSLPTFNQAIIFLIK